jgi:hypothetical protein
MNTKRIVELVELSEQVKNLACELNLDFIALMADMVLTESTQVLYAATDREEHVSAMPVVLKRRARGTLQIPPVAEMSNVTQLILYRDRKRTGTGIPA